MAWLLHDTPVDFRHLSWNGISSGTTGGCLPKTLVEEDGRIYYYKTSSYDRDLGFYGLESICELIASRAFQSLGIPCVRYELMDALISIDGKEKRTFLTRSESFLSPGEQSMSLGMYFEAMGLGGGERGLEALDELGLGNAMRRIFVGDYLIANRDRHSSNLEVILGTDGKIRMAPAFDFGLSLTAPFCRNPRGLESFDVLCDMRVNNFIGFTSLEDNLLLAESAEIEGNLEERVVDHIFSDLSGILPEEHLKKSSELMKARWERYEKLLDHERHERA